MITLEKKKVDGRGRPKVKDGRKHIVNIRLNDKELKQLQKYMKKHKISGVSPFIRKLVMAKVNQLELFSNAE